MKVSLGLRIAACGFVLGMVSGCSSQQPEPTHEAAQSDSAGHQHSSRLPHYEHSFEDVEQWEGVFDDATRDEWQMPERVIETLQIPAGGSVADIGAGTGYFTVPIAQSAAHPKVYAIDLEPAMVEHLGERAAREGLENVWAIQAGSSDPHIPEPVDLILIVNTYHHLPDRVAYFTALKGSLNPDGRVAIIDYRKGAPGGAPEKFRFTREQISRELTQAGFVLRESYDFLPRQLFLVYGLG